MFTFDLTNVQNQTFTTTLDGNRYSIAVYLAGGCMCSDVSIADVPVISGQRITPGQFLIPFPAYFQPNGNFLLLTQNDELADYTQFGITQTLIYLSYAEILASVI